MSEQLIELLTKQGVKLDEHLEHLRKTIHDTNDKLQGVIGTVQLTRQDMKHNNLMSDSKLDSVKVSITAMKSEIDKIRTDLKIELDSLDVDLTELKDQAEEYRSKVKTMYKAYDIMYKSVVSVLATGLAYSVYLVTKIKHGG